jgi:hypothetical protein
MRCLSLTFLCVASTSEQWANSPAREPQAISAAPALEIVSDIAQTMSEKKRRLFVTPAAPGCSFISFAAIEAVPFLAEKNDRVQIFAGLIRQFVTIWKKMRTSLLTSGASSRQIAQRTGWFDWFAIRRIFAPLGIRMMGCVTRSSLNFLIVLILRSRC